MSRPKQKTNDKCKVYLICPEELIPAHNKWIKNNNLTNITIEPLCTGATLYLVTINCFVYDCLHTLKENTIIRPPVVDLYANLSPYILLAKDVPTELKNAYFEVNNKRVIADLPLVIKYDTLFSTNYNYRLTNIMIFNKKLDFPAAYALLKEKILLTTDEIELVAVHRLSFTKQTLQLAIKKINKTK